jgi:hypothetical protein
VAEKTVKRQLRCGFRRTGKAMGQVYRCWWRICRETGIFSRFEYHMFYILYSFVIYLLSLPRVTTSQNWLWTQHEPGGSVVTIHKLKLNCVACSPQANYTDRAAAAC